MARGKKGKGKKGGDDEWEEERQASRKRELKPSAAAASVDDEASEAGPSSGKKLTRKQLRQQKLAAREARREGQDPDANDDDDEATTSKGKKGKGKKGKSTDERDWPTFVLLKGEGGTDGKLGFKRDIRINDVTVGVAGRILLEDSSVKLSQGFKYGLIGKNGIGKSVLMRAIANREPPFDQIPERLRINFCQQEVDGDDRTPLQHVLEADVERAWLLAELAKFEAAEAEGADEALVEEMESKNYSKFDIEERLREIKAYRARERATGILMGLGFLEDELDVKTTAEYSGGWRMRVAIAEALFVAPDLLILDEPSNHMDLEAVIWLEHYLSKWKNTLLVVAHDPGFLDEFVDSIVHYTQKQLFYYKGQFDDYLKQRDETARALKKKRDAQLKQIKQLETFINKNVQGGRQAKQAKSKQKDLARLKAELIPPWIKDKDLAFTFPAPPEIGLPILQVKHASFKYADHLPNVFTDIDIGFYLDSRVALVGPNGVGKSTLMKLMAGDLKETDGEIVRNPRLTIARFHQHHQDQLDLEQSPMEYLRARFPDGDAQELRNHLARFGLRGSHATQKIASLSGGQKSRVSLAEISWTRPHILLLDEPTNHLDMETIEALGQALNQFEGGLILISHHQRLIDLACNQLWVLSPGGHVKRFEGDFSDYKREVLASLPEIDDDDIL